MDNEAYKLPETPDQDQQVPAIQPGNIHPLSNDKASSNTVFSRFVQKVSLIFIRSPEISDIKLSGRIKELQTIANGVLFELLDFKKNIKEKIHSELFGFVVTILDPLIKEIGRTPPVIEKTDNTAQQVKMFSRYVDSIEKAKAWIEIGNVSVNEEILEKALIEQTAKEFLCRIDRDIQVIQDYLSHALASFELPDSLKDELKDKLMPDLSAKMEELSRLKLLPPDFSLKSFIQWRSHSDQAREVLFGEALHIIDNFSEEFLPTPKKETENDHQHAITIELKGLEEKTCKITEEIGNVQKMDINQQKNYIAMIERLEVEAHHLNGNLYLPHDYFERIEILLETLLKLREDLSY